MKNTIRSIALCTTVLMGVAFAGNTVISVEATGHGKTEREATDDALGRAAGQVNGANVSVDSTTVRANYDATARDSWGRSASVSASSEISQSAAYQAEGQIKTYRVLSSKKTTSGYAVSVRADVLRYDVPGENPTQRRIAIFPVRFASGAYQFYGPIAASELASQIGADLESKLISSRQFTVLDRRNLANSIAELAIVESDLSSPEEKSKLQRLKGADYVVATTIRKATDRDSGGVNAATGQSSGKFKFEVEVRVIVPATGELRSSDVIRVEKARDRDEAIEVMGTKTVASVIDQIYPGAGQLVRPATLSEQATGDDVPTTAQPGIRLPFDP